MRVGDSVANRRERASEREKTTTIFQSASQMDTQILARQSTGAETEAEEEGRQTKPLLDDSFAFRHKFFCHKVLTVCVCVCVCEQALVDYYYYSRRFGLSFLTVSQSKSA